MQNNTVRKPSICENYRYWPPEMQDDRDNMDVDDIKVDSWGVGICILECFSDSTHQVSSDSRAVVMDKIRASKGTHDYSHTLNITKLCKSLKFPQSNITLWADVLTGLLHADSEIRTTIARACEQLNEIMKQCDATACLPKVLPELIIASGHMEKMAGTLSIQTWQTRWCSMYDSKLVYYRDRPAARNNVPAGTLYFQNLESWFYDNSEKSLQLRMNPRIYTFKKQLSSNTNIFEKLYKHLKTEYGYKESFLG
jgi:hypothetical protein